MKYLCLIFFSLFCLSVHINSQTVIAQEVCPIKGVENWEKVPSCIYPYIPTNPLELEQRCYTPFLERKHSWEKNCKEYWEQQKIKLTPSVTKTINVQNTPIPAYTPTETPPKNTLNVSVSQFDIPSEMVQQYITPVLESTPTATPSPTIDVTLTKSLPEIIASDSKQYSFLQRLVLSIKLLLGIN